MPDHTPQVVASFRLAAKDDDSLLALQVAQAWEITRLIELRPCHGSEETRTPSQETTEDLCIDHLKHLVFAYLTTKQCSIAKRRHVLRFSNY